MKQLGKIETIELTKLPVGISEILDDYVIMKHGLQFESIFDPMLKGMIYRLKTYVLAEEIDCRSKIVSFDATFPVYRNWWQHFKGDIFPQWLKKRFPPKFNYPTQTKKKKVTFRKYATYPKANILFPDEVGTLIKYKSFIEEE